MIKPWIFEFFGAPRSFRDNFDPQVSQRYFDAYLDLWASAEPAGFEGIFFSEHHFGAGYSPAPNLLIANVALRTKKLRLGTLGMVVPYHAPWQLVEEIGMLDHLTGGRLEIGTAAGIPPELQKVGIGPDEARARNDEALEVLDAALKNPVVSHHGKFWNFDDLCLTPRPIQQPAPPVWVTVVSVASARKAARRGVKICTGFLPLPKIIEVFDAFRDEADKIGRKVGPDDLGLRRQVTMVKDNRDVAPILERQRSDMSKFLSSDPRFETKDRPAVLDTPTAHAYSVGDDEFIGGTTASVAEQIIHQCQSAGVGHFAALFDNSRTPEQLKEWYVDFGTDVIPRMRQAVV